MSSDPAPRRTATRELIPVVALGLFADKGYEATSMREIAEQLGITKAALYYHFDSKEDIVRALIGGMMDQVAELLEWAKAQTVTSELRREVLTRWSDIMHAHGLALFRFSIANQRVVNEVGPDPQGFRGQINELSAILIPGDANVEDRIRARVAIMSINLAGIAGFDIEATDAEIVQAARRVAIDLLPEGM